ncbi:MAG: FG-GAP repeat protein [Alcanivoracaceae bacterium]|nr:FG-GAP repeat protein [Alcanivoracaceae bacterium]
MKNLIKLIGFLLLTQIFYNTGFSEPHAIVKLKNQQAKITQLPATVSKAEWNSIVGQINGVGTSEYQQNAYIKASNTNGGDQFGYSVAISGNTMVIGANKEDSNAMGVNNNQTNNAQISSGAAYVFVRNTNGIWAQQAYLKASNTGNGDEFGFSVDISGDTIVVGAAFEDSNATGVNNDETNDLSIQSGAAYVFTRNAEIWSQQAYLKASNTSYTDWFGYSVAISGNTIVVGVIGEDSDVTGINNGTNELAESSGAAYVFTRDLGEWSQQAFLKASNTEEIDWFGYSVDIDDNTIVVGALHEDSNTTIINGDEINNLAPSSGAVYVYTRTVDTWSQQAYLKPSNTGTGDRFGCSVAVSGNSLVIGAQFEASNATGVGGIETNNDAIESGAAYIFSLTVGIWSQDAYLKASNTGGGDQFGYSVAVDNGSVMVGARYEDSNAVGVDGDGNNDLISNSGAGYVYKKEAGTWSQHAYLKSFNTGNNDVFGFAVSVSGDNIVIGAEWESSNATGVNNEDNNLLPFSGSVYSFNKETIFVNGFE